MAAKKSGSKSSPKINVHADKDSTISVRQIENGFIVAESGTRGKGKNKEWYNKEYYSKSSPIKINSGSTSTSSGMRFGKK